MRRSFRTFHGSGGYNKRDRIANHIMMVWNGLPKSDILVPNRPSESSKVVPSAPPTKEQGCLRLCRGHFSFPGAWQAHLHALAERNHCAKFRGQACQSERE